MSFSCARRFDLCISFFLCFYSVAKQGMSHEGMRHVIGDTILSGPACWLQIATEE